MQAVEQAIAQTKSALEAQRSLGSPTAEVEVEAQRAWSDERLKQAIAQTESALETLRALEAPSGEHEVEAHRFVSDERLKQAIAQTESALDALMALAGDGASEGGAAAKEPVAGRQP